MPRSETAVNIYYIYGITTKMEAYIDDIKVQVSIESTTKK